MRLSSIFSIAVAVLAGVTTASPLIKAPGSSCYQWPLNPDDVSTCRQQIERMDFIPIFAGGSAVNLCQVGNTKVSVAMKDASAGKASGWNIACAVGHILNQCPTHSGFESACEEGGNVVVFVRSSGANKMALASPMAARHIDLSVIEKRGAIEAAGSADLAERNVVAPATPPNCYPYDLPKGDVTECERRIRSLGGKKMGLPPGGVIRLCEVGKAKVSVIQARDSTGPAGEVSAEDVANAVGQVNSLCAKHSGLNWPFGAGGENKNFNIITSLNWAAA